MTHKHTATEIINFASDNCERPDCAICGDPACSHGIYELKVTEDIVGFRFYCATTTESGNICDCEGYEPTMPSKAALAEATT